MKKRIYAPGPTSVPEETRLEQAKSQFYHRSEQFGEVIASTRRRLQELLEVNWPVLFSASSGSGAMQMAAHHLVNKKDRVLVVDSGKFGRRWKKNLEKRGCRVISCYVERGSAVEPQKIADLLAENPDIKAVFATMIETSTLVRHPVEKLAEIVAPTQALFVVDAISALGAEPLYPSRWKIDVTLGASQKALMTPPGLSFLVLSPAAEKRAREVESEDTYFDINLALERLKKDGQTPWTPPMGLLRGLDVSLELIFSEGPEKVYERHRRLACLARAGCEKLGLELFAENPAVAGTSVLVPAEINAEKLRDLMYRKYGVFLPGGQQELKGRLIRIGHLGDLDYFDLITIFSALELAMHQSGLRVKLGTSLAELQKLYLEFKTV